MARLSPLGEAGACVVVAAIAGAAVYFSVGELALGAALASAGALILPYLPAGVTASEQLAVTAFTPTGAGPMISGAAMLGLVAVLLARTRRALGDACGPTPGRTSLTRARVAPEFRAGHVALLAIAGIALADSAFATDANLTFIALTVSACVPMLFIGMLYAHRSVPMIWVLMTAGVPVAVVMGVIRHEDVNPIALGHCSWIAAYFLWTRRHDLPAPVWMALAVVSLGTWAGIDQLGPRIAGGAALGAAGLGLGGEWRRERPVLRNSVRISRPIPSLLMVAGLVVLTAVLAAVREATAESYNNTVLRRAVWSKALGSAQWLGGGVTDFEVNLYGRSVELSSHNFIVDAVSSAGWVALPLLIFVLGSAFRGAWRARHPLVPYCIGIVVAKLFSGGLYRSPSLWLALGFLVACASGSVMARSERQVVRVEAISDIDQSTGARARSSDPMSGRRL